MIKQVEFRNRKVSNLWIRNTNGRGDLFLILLRLFLSYLVLTSFFSLSSNWLNIVWRAFLCVSWSLVHLRLVFCMLRIVQNLHSGKVYINLLWGIHKRDYGGSNCPTTRYKKYQRKPDLTKKPHKEVIPPPHQSLPPPPRYLGPPLWPKLFSALYAQFFCCCYVFSGISLINMPHCVVINPNIAHY